MKIEHERTVIKKCLGFKLQKFQAIFGSPKDILQKTVVGSPCFRTSLFPAHTRTQTMTDFRYKHNKALTSDLDIISSIGIFCPVASDQCDSKRQRVTTKDRKKLGIPPQSIFAAQFCVWIFVLYLVSLDLDVEHNLTFLHNCHVLHWRVDSCSLRGFYSVTQMQRDLSRGQMLTLFIHCGCTQG